MYDGDRPAEFPLSPENRFPARSSPALPGKQARSIPERHRMKTELRTLQYYNENAAAFISGTVRADMASAREKFLDCLPSGARILDFGCGSGRDTKAFLQQGFLVDAADGSEELCREASALTGIPVKHMLFQELDSVNVYDGIWACASILHLPKKELKEVLEKIAAALRPDGILYTSFKYGTFEGFRKERYFTDFTEESLREFWTEIPSLDLFETWITQDARPGREAEQWINLLARPSAL